MKITNIKSYQIEGKLKEPFWWGNGGNDKRSASIVKIETDEGIDGWGEGWGGINEFKDILKKYFHKYQGHLVFCSLVNL